jgi:hypothetical protein
MPRYAPTALRNPLHRQRAEAWNTDEVCPQDMVELLNMVLGFVLLVLLLVVVLLVIWPLLLYWYLRPRSNSALSEVPFDELFYIETMRSDISHLAFALETHFKVYGKRRMNNLRKEFILFNKVFILVVWVLGFRSMFMDIGPLLMNIDLIPAQELSVGSLSDPCVSRPPPLRA